MGNNIITSIIYCIVYIITSSHQSVKLQKFADYTTLTGLMISGGDESAHMWEIDLLVTWKTNWTVEMVVDFQKNPGPPVPITPCDSPVD